MVHVFEDLWAPRTRKATLDVFIPTGIPLFLSFVVCFISRTIKNHPCLTVILLKLQTTWVFVYWALSTSVIFCFSLWFVILSAQGEHMIPTRLSFIYCCWNGKPLWKWFLWRLFVGYASPSMQSPKSPIGSMTIIPFFHSSGSDIFRKIANHLWDFFNPEI